MPAEPPALAPRPPGAPLRLAFVGQAVERKGLPVLLRAFEALRDHVDVELMIVGADRDEVEPLLLDGTRGVNVLGKVSDAEKAQALASADLLVAPSLGGESFGMVLTEAFAAGTPVVASDIPGYRDVVRDGVDGVLVPRGDATALAETLRDLAVAPERRAAMAVAARAQRAALRLADRRRRGPRGLHRRRRHAAGLPPRASARACSSASSRPISGRAARPSGACPAWRPPSARAVTGGARPPARPASAWPAWPPGCSPCWRCGASAWTRSATACCARRRRGCCSAWASCAARWSSRGVAWHAILTAALPEARLRRSDALQGTFIGVLMSATLPARLGEPSRALIVARRTGRPRDNLPTVVGSIVSQTLLNVVALVGLGIVMFSTVDLFSQRQRGLVAFAIAPMAVLVAVLVLPALLRGGVPSRSRRVQSAVAKVRAALAQVRAGLNVFRSPKLGAQATALQLSAWVIQWLSCYVLLVALGLDDRAGIGAAAAVLFAVNVTAVLPITPSNLGVFQFACVAVLAGAYGVGKADALAYGIILQAVEIATAVVMGAPALVKEGMSWRDVRLRALHASPVQLDPLPAPPDSRPQRPRPSRHLPARGEAVGRARGLGLPAALRRRFALHRAGRSTSTRACAATGRAPRAPTRAAVGRSSSPWRCRWPTARPRGARRPGSRRSIGEPSSRSSPTRPA